MPQISLTYWVQFSKMFENYVTWIQFYIIYPTDIIVNKLNDMYLKISIRVLFAIE